MGNKVCCVCKKEFNFKSSKTGQELFGHSVICKDCCEIAGINMGIRGAFQAAKYNEKTVLEKVFKSGDAYKFPKDTLYKYKGYKEIIERKATCLQCGNEWYWDGSGAVKLASEMLLSNSFDQGIRMNQVEAQYDVAHCQKCGSSVKKVVKVHFWQDKNGSLVDKIEENINEA